MSPIYGRKYSPVPRLPLNEDDSKLDGASNYELESELDFDNLLNEMNQLQNDINV